MSKRKEHNGELLAAIANSVVRVHADYVGRGPTKARAHMHDDVVLCLLEDTLTRAERTLVQAGDHHRVLDARHRLREVMREHLVAEIERLTARRVRAAISGTQVEPDMSSYVFVLDGVKAEPDPP